MDYVLNYATHSKLSSQHGGEDLYEHVNLHFDDEQDIHTRYEKYKTNGCGHDLKLLTVLH
jgi:hypothetical protein